MRTILLILFLSCALSSYGQNISFEDPKFKAALIEAGFDTNADGEISESEALEVTQIKFANKELTSIKGIEFFKNVTWLDVKSNQLTSVDVREVTNLQNFYITNNMISELHVAGLQRLSGITGNNNQLSSLDLRDLPRFANLYISYNAFESIDLSNLPNLQRISTTGTKITKLDFSNNPKMYGITVNDTDLTELDLSGLCNLNSINFRDTKIKDLDLTDCVKLKSVLGSRSSLETLKIKNDAAETNIELTGLNNLHTICADNGDLDTLNQIITELGYNNVVINSNCDGPDLMFYYTDNDRDGYGDESTAEKACLAPFGKVMVAGDCNDADATINPGATEIPNNGIDEDCDGADATTAVLELQSSAINVFPNPASDFIYLKTTESLNSNLKLTFYSYTGDIVKQQRVENHKEETVIDISRLSEGLYLMHIQDGEHEYQLRVIIAR